MSASVNRPTNVKKRDESIESKLQLYGIYSAFKQGKVPSNEQIDVALNSFLESKALKTPSQKLSDDGRDLVTDTREVVRLAKYLFLSKNEGNLLQDFIWQTEQFDPKAVSAPGTPIDKKTAQQQGNEALEGLRTLGTLLITNGQFRKLLKDFTIIFRDVAGDAASSVAGRVRPSEDELSQVDRPAEDNTWHEKPDFNKNTLRQKVKGVYGGDAKKDAKDTLNTVTSGAQTGSSQPTDVDTQGAAKAGKGTLKEKYEQNVSDETKEKVKQRNEEYRRRAKEYYNKKMPQERREQTIWRLKKTILECQQHPDYSRAVETLLDLAEQYGHHGRSLAQEGTGTVKQTRTNLQQAQDDLKTIIERFANGTSTEPLWAAIEKLYQAARKDTELRDWFSSMNHYVRRCLLEQGYILEDSSTRDWNQLYDHGRFLLRDKHKGDTDRIIDEARFILEQFDKDPQNKEFGEAVQKLFLHLGNDQSGKPVFKPHLVKDLTDVIIPAIIENIEYVPVPRIEYSDPEFDVVIENLIFEADNLFPNVVEVKSDHYFKMGRKKIRNDHHQRFDVRMSGIQMDLRDVNFYIKRKRGFPSIEDMGVMNVALGGNGLSFEMKVSTAERHDSQRFFKVEYVDVDIQNLKVKFVKSKHKALYNLVLPLVTKLMRPAITKAVEKAIKDQCNRADKAMFEIKQDADRTLQESRQSAHPEERKSTPKMYSRYYSSAKTYMDRKKEEKKKKAESKVSNKKVNIAYTMHDSIFPDLKMPGATSERATKYKDLSRQGEKWQSPVFSIGKASQSRDIPRAPRIEEKLEQKRIFEESKHKNIQSGGFHQQSGGIQQQSGGIQQQSGGIQQTGDFQPHSGQTGQFGQTGQSGFDEVAFHQGHYQQQHQQGLGYQTGQIQPQNGGAATFGQKGIGQAPIQDGNGGIYQFGDGKVGGANQLGNGGTTVPGVYSGNTGHLASGAPASGLAQDPSTTRM